ncbi:hypothetical protein GCM10008119_07040 [Pedobacter mendelii]|uniref:Uncharacterized protein n=1 Tax=Pedobacter mendelii TaxID=1908240 RepID=A0ABQ2BGH3_9SPHI|nr:hypothetical protein GCM10008119_07040 [Pedobacter mendelii]
MHTIEIPTDFEEWMFCITKKCGITLSPDFLEQSIQSLSNICDTNTEVFIKHYGENHRQATLAWFRKAHSLINL